MSLQPVLGRRLTRTCAALAQIATLDVAVIPFPIGSVVGHDLVLAVCPPILKRRGPACGARHPVFPFELFVLMSRAWKLTS